MKQSREPKKGPTAYDQLIHDKGGKGKRQSLQ